MLGSAHCNLAEAGRPRERLAQVQENDKPILIYTTFPSPEAAERVGGELVEAGLVACVNIITGMTAIYIWQGQRQRDSECVMIMKTRSGLAETVIAQARSLHPYANPALIVLPVNGGSDDFLRWIEAQTATPKA
jgi:periplasmic divalent cation tolerance protein